MLRGVEGQYLKMCHIRGNLLFMKRTITVQKLCSNSPNSTLVIKIIVLLNKRLKKKKKETRAAFLYLR